MDFSNTPYSNPVPPLDPPLKQETTDNIYKKLPSPFELKNQSLPKKPGERLNCNNHIHTPYSFSSFSSMAEIFKIAVNEHINVLGINDFYSTNGFNEFKESAFNSGIFPLFNMEFIGLLPREQTKDIRVNDPNNPGRTYLCGKAFHFPFHLDEPYQTSLDKVVIQSQVQIKEMIRLTNLYFSSMGIPVSLSYNEIKKRFAKFLVRERHISRAIREAVIKSFPDLKSQLEVFGKILMLQIKEPYLSDKASLENLIRSRLLKKGGKAYVEETASSFLPVNMVIKLILNGGGIPCYPVLLDDADGHFTEFEKDWNKLYGRLSSLGIHAVELIPGRNQKEILSDFVKFFHEKGMVITFGTEHNTPEKPPLTVTCKGGTELGEALWQIQYQGICVLAAHQYLVSYGEEGYINRDGTARISKKKDFEQLGEWVLQEFFSIFK